jgi:hypothetical protein
LYKRRRSAGAEQIPGEVQGLSLLTSWNSLLFHRIV